MAAFLVLVLLSSTGLIAKDWAKEVGVLRDDAGYLITGGITLWKYMRENPAPSQGHA